MSLISVLTMETLHSLKGSFHRICTYKTDYPHHHDSVKTIIQILATARKIYLCTSPCSAQLQMIFHYFQSGFYIHCILISFLQICCSQIYINLVSILLYLRLVEKCAKLNFICIAITTFLFIVNSLQFRGLMSLNNAKIILLYYSFQWIQASNMTPHEPISRSQMLSPMCGSA